MNHFGVIAVVVFVIVVGGGDDHCWCCKHEFFQATYIDLVMRLALEKFVVLPTRPPSTMLVTMTMTQTPWSQTVRQKSPNVLATGPDIQIAKIINKT